MLLFRISPASLSTASGTPPFLLFLLLFFLLIPSPIQAATQPTAAKRIKDGQAIDLADPSYQVLFEELTVEHGFTRQELGKMFSGVTLKKRILELMDAQWEAKPYYQYAPLFITKKNIRKAKNVLSRHRTLLDRVEEQFGVDRAVIIAIWGIESRFGANQGGFNVFQALNTLFAAYPRRSQFFRGELIAFLLLCREEAIDPRTIVGSYAGAFGQTQLMPSSFRRHAVSFDGDSKRDVWHSTPDILASIANYLKHYNWTMYSPLYADIGYELRDSRLIAAQLQGRKGLVSPALIRMSQQVDIPPSPGNNPLSIVALELKPGSDHLYRYVAGYPNFQVITEWNHSNRYAMVVSEFAEKIQ
jgi:membrane-bound lytic murein transglycosylase B